MLWSTVDHSRFWKFKFIKLMESEKHSNFEGFGFIETLEVSSEWKSVWSTTDVRPFGT